MTIYCKIAYVSYNNILYNLYHIKKDIDFWLSLLTIDMKWTYCELVYMWPATREGISPRLFSNYLWRHLKLNLIDYITKF